MSQVKEIACSFLETTDMLGQDMESVTPMINGLIKGFVEQQ